MKNFVLFIIKMYQKYLSLDHGFLGKVFPNTRICRFNPSCSEYAYESVRQKGALKGLFYATKRVFRCNTFFTPVVGTYDPVI